MTYPHPAVTTELESWVFAKVDVSRERGVAESFGVPAVPVAVAVRADGSVLGRLPDFVEPGAFAVWLRSLSGGSANDE